MATIARVAVAILLPVASAGAQTFSHIITDTVALGQFSHVFAVADLNADALDDIVVGGKVDHDPNFTPADRLTKVPLHIFVSRGDGTFTHAPELVEGQIVAHNAVVLSADFNDDERNDLVVYDHAAYVDSESSGYGFSLSSLYSRASLISTMTVSLAQMPRPSPHRKRCRGASP